MQSCDVAVLGATGQLGMDLLRIGADLGLKVAAVPRDDGDVSNAAGIARALAALRPRAVVNCAAFHQVDKCEDDPAAAFAINAVGALHVARAAKDLRARLVHVSTDYVFDGAKPAVEGPARHTTAYAEQDLAGPLNTYGASKLAGEHLARIAHPECLVVRVSSLYGIAGSRGKGGNFIETILKRAKDTGGPLTVVDDQWMTPTSTADAARALLQVAAGGEARHTSLGGTLHVTNPESCTWHTFASEAVRLVVPNVEVKPIPASTYPSKAVRPRNSALCTDKLQSLGLTLPAWKDGLRRYLAEKGHVA